MTSSTHMRCPYPFARPNALETPVELAGLRERPTAEVTLPSGDPALLVTRHRDVKALLTDDRVSRNLQRPGASRITSGHTMFQDSKMDPDPPEHTRVRRLVMTAFSPTRVESLRPFITSVVDELLDAMEASTGPVDLGEVFAFPLPIRVICRLLGVPEADAGRFRGWTDRFLSVGAFSGPEIGRAMKELSAYIADLIEAKRRVPGDDLITDMIAASDDEDGTLTTYELHWWCRLLLLVGYETTATQLSGGIAMLLAHPEQLERLRSDWSLLPNAIDELLRWKLVGSSVSMLRYATEDIQLDGFTVPAGTSVIPAVDSANQDESVFDRPGEFDITRERGRNLTFSLGPHYCIGASLARAELEIATERLLRRFPSLQLAVLANDLRRQDGALLEGFTSMPVSW